MKESLDTAALLASEGDLDRAISIYEALTNRFPAAIPPLAGLAQTLQQKGRFSEAADRWQALIRKFPARVHPSWYINQAKSLMANGSSGVAAETLDSAALRFPNNAAVPLLLAEALAEATEWTKCINVWRSTLQRFPEQIKAGWLSKLAKALYAAGCTVEAQVVVEELKAAFPDHPAAHSMMATMQQRSGDFESALNSWEQCIRLFGNELHPSWLLGKFKCLMALWQIQEARRTLEELITRFPGHLPGMDALRSLAEECCDWEEALRWNEQFLKGMKKRDHAKLIIKGKLLAKLKRYEEAEGIAAALQAEPDSTIDGRSLMLSIYRAQGRLSDVERSFEQGSMDFPEDRQLLVEKCQRYLLLNETDRAAELLARIGEEDDDADYIQLKWQIVAVRDGRDALKQTVISDLDRIRLTGKKRLPALIRFLADWFINGHRSFLRDWRKSWGLGFVIGALTPMLNTKTADPVIYSTYIKMLICLGHDSFAIRLIDRLPLEYAHRLVIGDLRAWACARRGDFEGARKAFSLVLEKNAMSVLDSHIKELVLDSESRLRDCPAGVLAFLPVRDEMANLPRFLTHHRGIGVSCFVVIDNGSTDGTLEYLRCQPDVMLYRSGDNFADMATGMRWINELIGRHGQGHRCLFLDADEDFIYPDWERQDIASFCRSLEEEVAEGMYAFMLDVYPEKFQGTGYPSPQLRDLYFDNNYVFSGHVRSPYVDIRGGSRERLFGDTEWLFKLPLTRGGTARYLSNHTAMPLRMSLQSGLLVHHKLADIWRKGNSLTVDQDPQIANRGACCIGRYNRYNMHHLRLSGDDLHLEGVSHQLGDSRELIALGLMNRQVSSDQKHWDTDGSGLTTGKGAQLLRSPVVDRFRYKDTESAGPYSLIPGASKPVTMEELDRNRLIYSVDPAAKTILYTEHDAIDGMFSQPFLYMAQFDNARALIEVPFSLLDKMDHDVKAHPTFIFSIGRCGSTAMSNALSLAGMPSVSEPDIPTQIAQSRGRIVSAFGEEGIGTLLHAVSRSLAIHMGPRFAIKLRSQCNAIVDDIMESHPGAETIFMLRRWDSWVSSTHRVFGTPGPQLALMLRRGLMAYHRLMERGDKPVLIWYEELASDPGRVLSGLGLTLTMKPEVSDDAQAGTSIARDNVQDRGDEEQVKKEFLATWEHVKPCCLSDLPDMSGRLGL